MKLPPVLTPRPGWSVSAGTGLWRPLLAAGPLGINTESRLEARGILDSPWRPFWAHFRHLSPISGHVHYLTY